MSPGVQEKLHRDGARKTCLGSGLNDWASKQKLKGVSPPNFSSFHKFQFLGGVTKQTNNTENKQKSHLTTGNAAPWAVRTQKVNCSCPLEWTVPPRGSFVLFSCLLFNSWHSAKWAAFNPNWGSRTASQEEAWWGQQLSCWWQLSSTGEKWFGSVCQPPRIAELGAPSHLQMLLFRQIWPKLPHSFGSYCKCSRTDRPKERQGHGSPISLGGRHTSRQRPWCQQRPWPPRPVPVWTLMLSRLVWEWWWARSGNRSCWKHTFFFFFWGGGIIFDLDPFPGLAQSMTIQCLCQHKEAI